MFLPFVIAWLATKINCHQAHVIASLREENRIRKAKLKGKRIQLTDVERRRLAVLAHPIDRKDLKDISSIATADTLQRWYRRLVVQSPRPTPQGKRLGRPRVTVKIEQLTVRMATENPTWGYRRIQGALSNVGYHIDKSTVRNILRRNSIDPAPIRGSAGMSWSLFVKLHWEALAASGFFEARLSTLAHFWIVGLQPARNVSDRSVQRLSLIRHSAISLLALLAQQNPDLGSRWLSNFGTRFGLIVGWCERMSNRLAPAAYPASSQPLLLQRHLRLVEQERSPPLDARSHRRRLANPNHLMGSCASNSHQIVVSPVEDSRKQVSDYNPGTASFADSYARAA